MNMDDVLGDLAGSAPLASHPCDLESMPDHNHCHTKTLTITIQFIVVKPFSNHSRLTWEPSHVTSRDLFFFLAMLIPHKALHRSGSCAVSTRGQGCTNAGRCTASIGHVALETKLGHTPFLNLGSVIVKWEASYPPTLLFQGERAKEGMRRSRRLFVVLRLGGVWLFRRRLPRGSLEVFPRVTSSHCVGLSTFSFRVQKATLGSFSNCGFGWAGFVCRRNTAPFGSKGWVLQCMMTLLTGRSEVLLGFMTNLTCNVRDSNKFIYPHSWLDTFAMSSVHKRLFCKKPCNSKKCAEKIRGSFVLRIGTWERLRLPQILHIPPL